MFPRRITDWLDGLLGSLRFPDLCFADEAFLLHSTHYINECVYTFYVLRF
jgi:hypothetical protein